MIGPRPDTSSGMNRILRIGFGQGWTPAPTTAPKSPHELLRRGLFELEGREVGTTILTGADQTCGYLSGSPGE